ncbi:hypothetical protein C8R44DRAFT_771648 [Mycena epipterygia]|nr:hypothetical protein C8R44DRAFT_771648 [Mycena epipterygia]
MLIQRYNTAITILLESSALYLMIIIIFVIAQAAGGIAALESPAISLLSAATGQVMNIIPALVIVRVSLARSVDVDPTAGNLKLQSSVY